jgi:hypothetical protein
MFSTKLTLKVGGREVSSSQFADKMMDAALDIARKNLKTKIEAVRCPVHHQKAEAVLKDDRGLDFEVRGCCDVLAQEVKKKLA